MQLVEFRIKNFRSYRNEAVFSFKAYDSQVKNENMFSVELNDGSSIQLLKTAVILGPNASGKSNVLWALGTINWIVKRSREMTVGEPLGGYMPFLMDKQTMKDPCELAIDFIVDGDRFYYQLAFNSIIHSEVLYRYNKNEKAMVYERLSTTDANDSISVGPGWTSTSLDLSNMRLFKNQLLLSELGIRPSNGLEYVYQALVNIQAEPVNYTLTPRKRNEDIAGLMLTEANEKLTIRYQRLLQKADLGIEYVEFKENKEEDFKFPPSVNELVKRTFMADNRWDFQFAHQASTDSRVLLPLDMESAGTKALLGIGARVLSILEKGGVLAYDEMDMAIHPDLFQLLVSMFHNPQSNPLNAQLLFTCHTPSACEKMRADQVWFTEKSPNGASELFSAQDFEGVSIDLPFEKWYRSGRFGALPHIDDAINQIFVEDGKA